MVIGPGKSLVLVYPGVGDVDAYGRHVPPWEHRYSGPSFLQVKTLFGVSDGRCNILYVVSILGGFV